MQRVLILSLPLMLTVACFDADSDGLSNREEAELGTDPESADSDDDGLDDLAEVDGGTDPLVADSDGDGLNDGEEVNDYGSDPNVVDTDGDGQLGDVTGGGTVLLVEDEDPVRLFGARASKQGV